MALAAVLWPVPAALAADTPAAVADSEVHVARADGSFTVDMTIHVPVDPARAWAVLTDFEHMADFVPNLASSQVTERSDGLVKVVQKGVAKYGVFSTHFESTREIHLVPTHEIRAHGVGGNVQRMESLMQLEPDGTGTKLTYHAEVQPGFWFPPLVGPSLVQHQTAEQFTAMLHEMLKRP
ncbi:SRPBCC family protein [Rhodoferax sp.]|uniref:SRPBCC family protein n=1 Tax=Rhodoferax sp. TaxID=50421 RepID=UPI0025D74D8F|nr:SRPBCC family protein [Rhodoferax sp.]